SSRRRHTSWPRDWSSDVCSSDLHRRSPSSLPVSPLPFSTKIFRLLHGDFVDRVEGPGIRSPFDGFHGNRLHLGVGLLQLFRQSLELGGLFGHHLFQSCNPKLSYSFVPFGLFSSEQL